MIIYLKKNHENTEKSSVVLFAFYMWVALFVLTIADVGAGSSSLGTECTTVEDCLYSGHVICDKESHRCVCRKGYTLVRDFSHCSPIKQLGEVCEFSEQCSSHDPNSACGLGGVLDPYPKICQCPFGFEEKIVKGKKECVDAHYKQFHTGGLYSDRRDTVSIVMGSVAAVFALLACFAGIFQFVRYWI